MVGKKPIALFEAPPAVAANGRKACGTSELGEFVEWLVEHRETCGLSARRLRGLYTEWCDVSGRTELTTGQLFRRRASVGIERYREPVGCRRWLYRVRSLEIVARHNRRTI